MAPAAPKARTPTSTFMCLPARSRLTAMTWRRSSPESLWASPRKPRMATPCDPTASMCSIRRPWLSMSRLPSSRKAVGTIGWTPLYSSRKFMHYLQAQGGQLGGPPRAVSLSLEHDADFVGAGTLGSRPHRYRRSLAGTHQPLDGLGRRRPVWAPRRPWELALVTPRQVAQFNLARVHHQLSLAQVETHDDRARSFALDSFVAQVGRKVTVVGDHGADLVKIGAERLDRHVFEPQT